jgi:mono/diheme cytochrome c family protein
MNIHSRLSYATILIPGIAVGLTAYAQQGVNNPGAATLKNPVVSTQESLGVGKRAYDTNCAPCHGNLAQGAAKAGIAISIIAEQGGKQPPDLTDPQWDHGSTDGEIFSVIKKGVPPTMMAGWEGRLSDAEIWSIVNYLRALPSNKEVIVAPAVAADTKPQHTL